MVVELLRECAAYAKAGKLHEFLPDTALQDWHYDCALDWIAESPIAERFIKESWQKKEEIHKRVALGFAHGKLVHSVSFFYDNL